jgi:hypothetical protein
MRVPLALNNPLGQVIDGIPKMSTRRRVLQTLSTSALIQSVMTFKEAVATASSTETKAHLFDLRELLCWRVVDEQSGGGDVNIESNDLVEFLESDHFLDRFEDISAPLSRHEGRDQGFRRKFESPVNQSRRIEVLDPFAAVNVMKMTEGTVWFLNTVLKSYSGVLAIFSSEPLDAPNFPAGVTEKRKIVQMNLEKIIRPLHNFTGSLRFTLVDSNQMPHNRRLSLRFDSGQATVLMEKGLATFDSDPFSESHVVSNADSSDLKETLAVINNSRDKYEIVLAHSQVCTNCPAV